MSKVKKNNAFINKQRLEGRTFCYIGELPYPESANLSVTRGPGLHVDKVRILFNELSEQERQILEKELCH